MQRFVAAAFSSSARVGILVEVSISRNLRIHIKTPSLYPTNHVIEIAETLLRKIHRRLRAASAVMAQERERGVLGQRQQSFEPTVFESRIFDRYRCDRTLFWRAHIDEGDRAGTGLRIGVGDGKIAEAHGVFPRPVAMHGIMPR